MFDYSRLVHFGHTRHHLDLGGDAPDYSGMNAAALESARLSKESFDWFKGEYERTRPDREAAQARASEVADSQLEGMNFAVQQAKDMDTRNKTVFQPMEDQIVADAKEFDTPGRRMQAMAEARADVESGFGSAQDGLNRTLMRMEAMPSAGKSAVLMQDAALEKAKALAGSTNAAVKDVEAQGYARKMDAAALGKGIVGNQATQQQIATSTGNSSSSNAAAALNASMSGAGLMGQGFNTALQGQAQAGNLYGQVAKMQADASNQDNGLMGALGSIGGAYAGSASGSAALTSMFAMSDEGVKKNTNKPANTKKMLDGVEKTQVMEDWQYDPSKGGPDMGGQKFDGPMAAQVRKTMGDKVAPGGKVINLVSMNGQLMGAVQELAKQQEKTQRRIAKMEQKVAA